MAKARRARTNKKPKKVAHKGKYLQWSKGSEDGRRLEMMIENNEIDLTAAPSDVLQSLGWDGRYSPSSFRGAMHRAKCNVEEKKNDLTTKNTEATLVNSDDDYSLSEDDDEKLGFELDSKKPPIKKQKVSSTRTVAVVSPRNTLASLTNTASKPPPSKSCYNSMDLNDVTNTAVEGTTENGTPFSFPLLYWQWIFKDKEAKQEYICISMCLPSGLVKGKHMNGELVPSVAADGNSIIVRVQWPNFFTNLTLLQNGLKKKHIHPTTMNNLIMAAKNELIDIRKGLGRGQNQVIQNTTIIPLKREVETSIKTFSALHNKKTRGMSFVIILKVRNNEVGELACEECEFDDVDAEDSENDNDGMNDALL